MTNQSEWKQFVARLEKRLDMPILITLIKKTTLTEVSNHTYVVSCPNSGVRMYLESKKTVLEEFFRDDFKKSAVFVFFTKEGEKRKRKEEPPLVQFEKKTTDTFVKSGLQRRFAFENFAVSPSNHIAHAAALTVSEAPGTIYNPLFVYGGVGVGKTHLSQAIANKILNDDSKKNVLFCTSEEFTNDLIDLIRQKNTVYFRNKYRTLDVLIVDDIQFIAGKNYVQEEFYHTFNTIIKQGGQIILTSDRSPEEIKKLEDRLRSRFSGGLTIDIQRPDFELRTAILLIKAKERNIPIDMAMAQLIAEKTIDVRQLEGRLLTLYTRTLSGEVSITSDLISQEFKKEEARQSEKITPQHVIKTICSYYNISPSQLKREGRKENVVLPRQIAMYILRTLLRLKFEEIAFLLKRKDHTTIMHGVDKITSMMLKNTTFKEEVEKLGRSLSI